MKKFQTKHITDYTVCTAFAIMGLQKKFYNWEKYDTAEIILGKMFPFACEKVIFNAMFRAENRGLIESGVSTRTGWLTQEGINLLK